MPFLYIYVTMGSSTYISCIFRGEVYIHMATHATHIQHRNNDHYRSDEGPKNEYMFFMEDNKESVYEELSARYHGKTDVKGRDVMTVLGQRWRKLTAEEKTKYIDRARVDIQRYIAEKTAYDNYMCGVTFSQLDLKEENYSQNQ